MSTCRPQNYVKFDPHDIKEPKSLDLFLNKLAHKELMLVHSEYIVIVTKYRLIQNTCDKGNENVKVSIAKITMTFQDE